MNRPDWSDPARDQLADIWVGATPDERDVIEKVVEQVERDLAKDPYAVGESRNGPIRVLVRSPLTFWYTVNASGRARIYRVRRHPPRSP